MTINKSTTGITVQHAVSTVGTKYLIAGVKIRVVVDLEQKLTYWATEGRVHVQFHLVCVRVAPSLILQFVIKGAWWGPSVTG